MPHSVLVVLSLLISLTVSAKRYIVILEDDVSASTVSKQIQNLNRTAKLGQPLQVLKDAFTPKKEIAVAKELRHLRTLIVDGDAGALELFRNSPGVARIEEDIIFDAPAPIGGPAVDVRMRKRSGGAYKPWGIKAVKAPEAWAINGRGKGVRVLVLDTGIDKDHPDLRKNFEKGKSFVDGAETDPYDYFDAVGHGTHVAGTILASGDSEIYGVAPEATLLAGRICADEGCATSAIFAGVEWAIEEKADVVNMSLGGPYGMPGEYLYRRAADQNVIIVAAAGNNGTSSIDYPARYASTIAVGAIDQSLTRAQFSQYGAQLDVVAPGVGVQSSVPQGTGRAAEVTVSGITDRIETTPFIGAGNSQVKGELQYVGLGKPADYEGVDLRGKIALIRRGEITFGEKVLGAVEAGAIGALVFNNEAGLINGVLSPDGSQVTNVPVAMITLDVGQAIVDKLESERVRGSVGLVASHYAEMQGTSMATPHVAGVIALMRAANANLTLEKVRDILKNNATELSNPHDTASGIVNAAASVRDAMGRAFIID